MKKRWMMALLVIVFSGCQNASRFLYEMEELSTSEYTCSLPGPDFQERKASLQSEVFAHVSAIEEQESGYIFHFRHDQVLLDKLFQYVMAESICCPFFQHDLRIQADAGGISWSLSGPEGVKNMLKTLLAEMDLKAP